MGVFEMSEDTAIEIDEPGGWIAVEKLLMRVMGL
jgi:CMP-N-acetylneuraminic acid synthetase